jgi:hypothetical protein
MSDAEIDAEIERILAMTDSEVLDLSRAEFCTEPAWLCALADLRQLWLDMVDLNRPMPTRTVQ